MTNSIFYPDLLRHGPWQEFERNTARLLLHSGWKDIRLIGRPRDGGADVLAVSLSNEVWLFQCKFSNHKTLGASALTEIRNAGVLYGADRLCVVSSQEPAKSFARERERLKALGLNISHFGPKQLWRMAESVPVYSPNGFELRDYQKDALDRLYEAVIESGKGHLVMATGLGKTVVIASLVDNLLSDGQLGDGRVLVLAHTVPLIDQLIVSFWRHLPKNIATHRYSQGERPISFEGITFATVQSFANIQDPPVFDLVVIDEAHHLGAPTYIEVLTRIGAPKIIGVTATPWRADGISIHNWIGDPVYHMGIQDGLANGFLSNVDYRIFADDIDWNMIREQSRYGYTIAQLNKRLLIPSRDEQAIREMRKVFEYDGRRRGIVFSPSQVHARSFASDLRMNGFRAQALTSEDSHIIRYRRLAEFASGQLDFLCAVDIFNEGIDVPDVDLLVFLRVTHSRRIFIQQLGRGLRISPNKDKVIVLDFVADIRRIHAALDLRRSSYGDELVERLLIQNALITFSNKRFYSFFNHWMADLVSIEDYEDDDLVYLPILDLSEFDFPEPLD